MPFDICIGPNQKGNSPIDGLKERFTEGNFQQIISSDFIKNRFQETQFDLILENVQNDEISLFEGLQSNQSQLLLELAQWTSSAWPVDHTIRVNILNAQQYPARVILIENAAREWARHAKINFDFVGPGATSDIRIELGHDGISQSLLGIECLKPQYNNYPTMRIAPQSQADVYSTALHEFGHALGFVHEHQVGGIVWNEPTVIAYCQIHHRWTEAKTRHNIINNLPKNDIKKSVYDPDSIMHYYFPSFFVVGGGTKKTPNTVLSPTDIAFAKVCYPGR